MRFWLTLTVLIVLLAASFWRGGKPERIVAGSMAGAFALELCPVAGADHDDAIVHLGSGRPFRRH